MPVERRREHMPTLSLRFAGVGTQPEGTVELESDEGLGIADIHGLEKNESKEGSVGAV